MDFNWKRKIFPKGKEAGLCTPERALNMCRGSINFSSFAGVDRANAHGKSMTWRWEAGSFPFDLNLIESGSSSQKGSMLFSVPQSMLSPRERAQSTCENEENTWVVLPHPSCIIKELCGRNDHFPSINGGLIQKEVAPAARLLDKRAKVVNTYHCILLSFASQLSHCWEQEHAVMLRKCIFSFWEELPFSLKFTG